MPHLLAMSFNDFTTAGNNGHMCIGLAVSNDPTGPFECYNEPLVYSNWTNRTTDYVFDEATNTVTSGVDAADAGWNDIDPTAWVTDDGEMYVAWGNTNSFMCQVAMVDSDPVENGTGYDVELEIVDQSVKHETGRIETTDELVELIKAAIPVKMRTGGGHPAKRTFQAIRIEVNQELQVLQVFLFHHQDARSY